MIQQDTLQILSDSTKTLQADSLARVDSLARADSLAMVDSLRVVDSIKTVIRLTRGFIGTPHPSVPQSESWVFIVLLALFFLLAYAVSNSGSLISETAKNFFQVKERSSIFSKATVNDFKIRLLIIIFSIGVISLFVFYQLHNPESPFRLLQFCFVLAITFLFIGLKVLIFDLLGYVFIETSNLKMAKEAYFNIVSFLGMTLFPLLVVRIYIPYNLDNAIETTSLIVCILGLILIIFKLFQIFFHKIVASFYILLYLCTLEILPLIAIYKVYKLIM